ncbi:apolipoprotein D-like [Panonychus citri]|uniref:apolipoprotein D-like n=1 Tax=Panonychus citri TaxID=50023 RepID=UPI002307E6B2|nr:apolipoprotein D-like [Panonychus citri]
MKFILINVFTLALVTSTLAAPAQLDPQQLIKQIQQLLPNLFNYTNLQLPNLNEIAQSVTPGKCPETKSLAEPFKINEFLGTWYEIERTNLIFEKGQRCVQANYKLEQSTGNVVVNNSGINNQDKSVFNVGTGKPTDKDNVLAVKFFPLSPAAQYWVVDTDYTNYALIVSCNDILGLFNINDAWILSRQSTLPADTIDKLKSELQSLGLSQLPSRFMTTQQNC